MEITPFPLELVMKVSQVHGLLRWNLKYEFSRWAVGRMGISITWQSIELDDDDKCGATGTGCFEATESPTALRELEISRDCSASAQRLVEPRVLHTGPWYVPGTAVISLLCLTQCLYFNEWHEKWEPGHYNAERARHGCTASSTWIHGAFRSSQRPRVNVKRGTWHALQLLASVERKPGSNPWRFLALEPSREGGAIQPPSKTWLFLFVSFLLLFITPLPWRRIALYHITPLPLTKSGFPKWLWSWPKTSGEGIAKQSVSWLSV